MRPLIAALSTAALSVVALVVPAASASAAPIAPESFGAELTAASSAFKSSIAGKPILIQISATDSNPSMSFYIDPSGAAKASSGDGSLGVCRPPVNGTSTCYSKTAGEKKWTKDVARGAANDILTVREDLVDGLTDSALKVVEQQASIFTGGPVFDKTVDGSTTTISYGGEVVGSAPGKSVSLWTYYAFTPTQMYLRAVVTETGKPDLEAATATVTAVEKQPIAYPKKSQIKK